MSDCLLGNEAFANGHRNLPRVIKYFLPEGMCGWGGEGSVKAEHSSITEPGPPAPAARKQKLVKRAFLPASNAGAEG
jgi:hypothetical protein